MNPDSTLDPQIRDGRAITMVSVPAKAPVDGTRHPRRSPSTTPRRQRATPVRSTKADPRAVAAAQRLCGPGQRLVTVSPTEVWVVNRAH